MSTFVYKAKKSNAETVTGEISAGSEDEAIDLINQLGLLPVSIEEAGSTEGGIRTLGRPQKVTSKELYIFSKQLAGLLRSGVSLLRALYIIEKQTQKKYFSRVISKIASDVKNGRAFSDSLTDYPHIFSSLYVVMVKAGEESGNIKDMLLAIGAHQKKQAELLSKIQMGLAYPVLMALVGMGTIYFILTFVLPKMSGLFANMGDALPAPTVMLLNMSAVLSQYWMWILMSVLLSVLIFQRLGQLDKGKMAVSRLLLQLPVFGDVIIKSELARFSRTLVLLLKSGVSILRSLEITIPILSNEVIKEQLFQGRNKLEAGGSLGESLMAFREIPEMVGHLIAVGEESGNLDEVLADLADTYEQEADDQIKLMTTLFEPVMILLVGGVVGFIVFAMLLPIFQVDVLS